MLRACSLTIVFRRRRPFVVSLAKAVLFRRHLRAAHLTLLELVAFFLLQPALDVSYTFGLAEGLWHLVRGKARGPIR